LAIQSATRAYELRHRTTDPERFFIEYAYDRDVTGDLEKAFQAVTVWTQTYPRDLNAWGLRGGYSAHGTGRYEDVIQSTERALASDPDFVFAHGESVSANMFLDRFDAAKRALQRAGLLLEPQALAIGYYIALLEHDTGSIGDAGAIQDSSDPSCCDTPSRWPSLAPGQLERADARAEAIDATEALGRRETGDPTKRRRRCGKHGRKSGTGRRRCDGPQDVECRDVRATASRALALGEAIRSESQADDLERRFTRYPRQIHVCADAARARGNRAQRAGQGDRTASGKRPL
jgi:tetratricopeptide (TPR) repeat protein